MKLKYSVLFLQCFIHVVSYSRVSCAPLSNKARNRYKRCFELKNFVPSAELNYADNVCVTSGETFIVFLSSKNDGIPVVILFEKSNLKIVYLVECVITLLNTDTQMSAIQFRTHAPALFTIVCVFKLKTELLEFYHMLYADVPLHAIPTVMSKIQRLYVRENENDAPSRATTVAQHAIIHYEDFKYKSRTERAFTITRLDYKNPVLIFQTGLFDLSEVKQNNILLRVDGYVRAFFILSFVNPDVANNFRSKEFELITYTKGFLPILLDVLPFMEVFTE